MRGRVRAGVPFPAQVPGGNAFNFSINIQSSDGPGVRAALAEAVPVIEARVSRAVKGEVQADLARPSALRGAARG